MSWEYERYEAHCEKCGHVGVCIKGSDDWCRSSTSWEGFKCEDPDATAVGRQRIGARDRVPVCICGSTQITVSSLPNRS